MSTFNFTSTNPLGNFALKIGNSKSYPMRALRPDGATPIDLTGASFKWCFRNLPLETAAVMEKAFGPAYASPDPSFITVTNAGTGDFILHLKPADTAGLLPRTIKHDLEITEADGTVSTILEGDIELADHAARGN